MFNGGPNKKLGIGDTWLAPAFSGSSWSREGGPGDRSVAPENRFKQVFMNIILYWNLIWWDHLGIVLQNFMD